ncbi:MAG: Ig-like domain-containing protein, partial [Pseudomonadota bacterium]
MIKQFSSWRKWRSVCLLCTAGAFGQAAAEPIANDVTVGELLDVSQNITFNVHTAGLAAGDPAPVYLDNGFEVLGGPASLQVTKVGDACLQVRWGEDNPDSTAFEIQYSLVAGDQTGPANPGTLRFERGNGQLTNVVDVVNGCGDPRNSAPTTTDATFTFPANSDGFRFPIIVQGGPVSDADGLETVRFTNETCWVQPQNGTVQRSLDGSTITFNPNPEFRSGSDSFEYCVTDNPLDFTTGVRGRVSFTIEAPAEPVTIVDDTATTTLLTPVLIDVLANDTVPNLATIVAVDQPGSGGFVRIVDQAQCVVAIPGITTSCVEYSSPSSDDNGNPFSGDDSFTYSVGTADVILGRGTVTVTVLPDDPLLSDDTATTQDNVPVVIDVRANDATLPGEVLESVSNPSAGGTAEILTPEVCSITITGTTDPCIRYTPPLETFSGQETFTYTVSNGPVSSTATVTVTVEAPAPTERTLTADTATTEIDTPVVIDVLGNDALIDGDVI